MERHFATWGDGGAASTSSGSSARRPGMRAYRAFPGRWTFFSDVNGAVAKWAWERFPYRSVPYAEDQLLGREVIEAGLAKVFHPEARVLHSHDYPPLQFFRRYFDEFRSLREVLGHVEALRWTCTPMTIRGLIGHDKRWLRRQGVRGSDARARRWPSPRATTRCARPARSSARARTACRAPVRKLLSLEGRATVHAVDVPTRARCWREPEPGAQAGRGRRRLDVGLRPRAPTRSARSRRVAHARLDARRRGRSPGSCPPWRIGSGGHTTIFRLIRQLELRGHRCAIFVFDPFEPRHAPRRRAARGDPRALRARSTRRSSAASTTSAAPTSAIATEWWTAFPVRDLPGCREKVYLVQDHEPEFYATSAESMWAEETYRMGYRCIAYTPWMADLLSERYGHGGALVRVRHRPRHVPLRGRGGARRRADRRLRAARRPSAAPSTSRWPGSPCSPTAGPTSAPCCSARARRSRCRSRPTTSASCRRRGSPSSTAGRARGSCSRSPPTRWWRRR